MHKDKTLKVDVTKKRSLTYSKIKDLIDTAKSNCLLDQRKLSIKRSPNFESEDTNLRRKIEQLKQTTKLIASPFKKNKLAASFKANKSDQEFSIFRKPLKVKTVCNRGSINKDTFLEKSGTGFNMQNVIMEPTSNLLSSKIIASNISSMQLNQNNNSTKYFKAGSIKDLKTSCLRKPNHIKSNSSINVLSLNSNTHHDREQISKSL